MMVMQVHSVRQVFDRPTPTWYVLYRIGRSGMWDEMTVTTERADFAPIEVAEVLTDVYGQPVEVEYVNG